MLHLCEPARRIRKARRERELTQLDVALAVGLSQTYLSSFERGYALPRLETLKAIAALLAVDFSQVRADLIAVLPQVRILNARLADELEQDQEAA